MGILSLLLVSLGINGVFFALAYMFKTDAFTDLTYSLTFIILTALMMIHRAALDTAQIITGVAVFLWAIRLGSYLFTRIMHTKVDHRFDDKRDSFIRFGSFWFLQAITVWIVLLPVYGILHSPGTTVTPALLLLSICVWLIGLIIEAVADQQKFLFKKDPANAKKFMQGGLWAWSRHPNYFGEICFWTGVSIPGLALFEGTEVLLFLGPVFITIMLLFVSGIPLLEKSWEKKWGKTKAYKEYKKHTPLLIPWPPRKAKVK